MLAATRHKWTHPATSLD